MLSKLLPLHTCSDGTIEVQVLRVLLPVLRCFVTERAFVSHFLATYGNPGTAVEDILFHLEYTEHGKPEFTHSLSPVIH